MFPPPVGPGANVPVTPVTSNTGQTSQTQTPPLTQTQTQTGGRINPFAGNAGNPQRSALFAALKSRRPKDDDDDDDASNVNNYVENHPSPSGGNQSPFKLGDVLYGTTHALGLPSEAEVKGQVGVPNTLPLTMAFEYRSAMPFLAKAEKAFKEAEAKNENPHKAFAAAMATPFPGTKFDKATVEKLREFHAHLSDESSNHYLNKPIGPHTLLKGNDEADGNMRPFVRTSKAILDFALKSGSNINVVTTEMNMQDAVGKKRYTGHETNSGVNDGSRITESEVRFLYRKSATAGFDKQVQFWELGNDKKTLEKVDAPWKQDPALWDQYDPASGKPGANTSGSNGTS